LQASAEARFADMTEFSQALGGARTMHARPQAPKARWFAVGVLFLALVGGALVWRAPVQRAEMVSVPGGSFRMGCNERVDLECFKNEKPARDVEVAAFSIDKTEVTVSAYQNCVNAGRCSEPGTGIFGAGSCNWGAPVREQHPINCVDWHQALAYCEWAGKRLPTEAEWEKAARGTDGRKYPWGNGAPSCDKAIFSGCGSGTQAVGDRSSGASPYGALDMSGNVYEWTAGEYAEGHSLRGGSWHYDPGGARASYRAGVVPGTRYPGIGFRCAQ